MQLQITEDFKTEVFAALMQQRQNYSGADAAFAKIWGINKSVFSQLKGGKTDKLLTDNQWLNIGRELGIGFAKTGFKVTRTEVLTQIEEEVLFCKENSKALMFVDDAEIGKTVAAVYLSKTIPNCFYVDGSQCKTAHLFVRKLAKTIGIDSNGKIADVKENIKFYLKMLPKPVVITDDGGDLKPETFLELKELWNATEGYCGWYMLGDDSLENYISKAITSKRPGFRAFFSRYSSTYSSITPRAITDKISFYKKLIEDVLLANMADKTKLNSIVNQCIKNQENGHIGGLRRAESLLILNN